MYMFGEQAHLRLTSIHCKCTPTIQELLAIEPAAHPVMRSMSIAPFGKPHSGPRHPNEMRQHR